MVKGEEQRIFATQNFKHQEYKAHIIRLLWCIKLIVEAKYSMRLMFKRFLSKTSVS